LPAVKHTEKQAVLVVVAGEVHSRHKVNVEQVVRTTLAGIGYGSDEAGFHAHTCTVVNRMHEQSQQIRQAVVRGEELAAGDQGVMFGYATDETHCHMPPSIYLAREIIRELQQDRRQNPDSPLRPDAKSQVTLALNDDGTLDHVQTVVVSTCHRASCHVRAVRDHVKRLILEPRLPEKCLADAFRKTEFILNPSGAWTLGGPATDMGLSGRKIVMDNYGSECPLGGLARRQVFRLGTAETPDQREHSRFQSNGQRSQASSEAPPVSFVHSSIRGSFGTAASSSSRANRASTISNAERGVRNAERGMRSARQPVSRSSRADRRLLLLSSWLLSAHLRKDRQSEIGNRKSKDSCLPIPAPSSLITDHRSLITDH
jgi:hypothetical protein